MFVQIECALHLTPAASLGRYVCIQVKINGFMACAIRMGERERESRHKFENYNFLLLQ